MTALAPSLTDVTLPHRAPRPATLRFVVRPCALGLVLVAFEQEDRALTAASSDAGVCAVLLGDDAVELRDDLAARFPAATLLDGGSDLTMLADAVAAHVDDPRTPCTIPLVMRGTVLQRAVWRRLCEIPLGETVSYGEIAASLGLPYGARAVAQACAANPLAVVVPCHRVVRGDGSLAGYRWGVARKRALLQREARAVSAVRG